MDATSIPPPAYLSVQGETKFGLDFPPMSSPPEVYGIAVMVAGVGSLTPKSVIYIQYVN
jgi:hypothetical protein